MEAGDVDPDDITALKAALAIAEAELAVARARAAEDTALIAHQKLRIAKLEHQIWGQRSERSRRLLDQLALTFEDLEADATEDELAAEQAVARTTMVRGFTRQRAERNTFPDHLPRERVVIDPPTQCECCGGTRLRKLGEDVTRTLETIPRQWKVIETVREKFTCRDCEKISQAPAPFHAIARGWAGPRAERHRPRRRAHDLRSTPDGYVPSSFSAKGFRGSRAITGKRKMRTITLIILSSASGAIACGLPGYLIGMIFDTLHMSLYESDGITYQNGGGSMAPARGEIVPVPGLTPVLS